METHGRRVNDRPRVWALRTPRAYVSSALLLLVTFYSLIAWAYSCESNNCESLKTSQFAFNRYSQLKPDLRYYTTDFCAFRQLLAKHSHWCLLWTCSFTTCLLMAWNLKLEAIFLPTIKLDTVHCVFGMGLITHKIWAAWKSASKCWWPFPVQEWASAPAAHGQYYSRLWVLGVRSFYHHRTTTG